MNHFKTTFVSSWNPSYNLSPEPKTI